MPQAVVIIDYQNIHLTGHGRFCPEGLPRHESLVHPLHFSNQLLHARASARRRADLDDAATPALELTKVVAFRGLPGNRQQPESYRRSLAQQSEWTRDRRVQVVYRPLKYVTDSFGRWTAHEKGVDVQVALELVNATNAGDWDVVILAAHDTDQLPALEYALAHDNVTSGRVHVETAGWVDCKRLTVPRFTAWHTFMNGRHFVDARDRKNYR